MSGTIRQALINITNTPGDINTIAGVNYKIKRGTVTTIGRDLECDVVIGDPHIAAKHAELALSEEGYLILRDLGSLNGTWLDGKRIDTAESLRQQNYALRIGRTQLAVRSQGDELAAELPLYGDALAAATSVNTATKLDSLFNSTRVFFVAALATIAITFAITWSQLTTQRDVGVTLASAILGQLIAVGAWVALWALISRVVRGAPRWKTHATIVFAVAAALLLLGWVLDLGAFAATALLPSALGWWLMAAAATLLLFLHLRAATRLDTRRLIGFALLLPALLLGLTYWQAYNTEYSQARQENASPALFPPSLRVLQAASPESLFKRADAMKAEALKRRDKSEAETDDFADD
jgi:hypothetical protein